MSQHFREFVTNQHALCGADLLGRRNHQDLLSELTTCMLCRAIIDRNHVYVVLTWDDEGHIDIGYFNTIEDQVNYANLLVEDAKDEDYTYCQLMYILLPDEIPTDDLGERMIRYEKALAAI